MIQVSPFRGWRPEGHLAEKIAELPYDVMSEEEAREMAEGNPLSFLHVDRAEIDFPEKVDPYSDAVYDKARENLNSYKDKGQMIQDQKRVFYIYSQSWQGRSQTGLVAACSCDDYLNDRIKKHEHTLKEKEIDRTKHIEATNSNTGLIFLTYRKNSVSKILEDYKESHDKIFSFYHEDVLEEGWIVDEDEIIDEIESEMGALDSLYIADGHHRAASTVNVCIKKRKENPDYRGDESFNRFLAVAFPSDQLHIMDYNRLVKTYNGRSEKEILDIFKEDFSLEKTGSFKEPEEKGQVSLYMGGTWYRLLLKESSGNIVDRLDVTRLQEQILRPYFGIDDPRSSSDIDFIGGIRGEGELEKRVDQEDQALAFRMYPTDIDELMEVSDLGLVMPPKSTWFEPKLLSGLFIHDLDED